LEAIKQMPTCAKFLQDMCTFKRKSKDYKSQKVFLSEEVNSILKFDTPSKLEDPCVSTTSYSIDNHKIERALLDLGCSVDLIPYSVYLELKLGELKPSNCTLQFADRLVRTLRGQIDAVLIQINKGLCHVDFIVLDIDPNHASKQIPVILGDLFLIIANAAINYRLRVMDVSVMNMRVKIDIFKDSFQHVLEDKAKCFFVNVGLMK